MAKCNTYSFAPGALGRLQAINETLRQDNGTHFNFKAVKVRPTVALCLKCGGEFPRLATYQDSFVGLQCPHCKDCFLEQESDIVHSWERVYIMDANKFELSLKNAWFRLTEIDMGNKNKSVDFKVEICDPSSPASGAGWTVPWGHFPGGVSCAHIDALLEACDLYPKRVKPNVREVLSALKEKGCRMVPHNIKPENIHLFMDCFQKTKDVSVAEAIITDVDRSTAPTFRKFSAFQVPQINSFEDYLENFPSYLELTEKAVKYCGLQMRRERGDLAAMTPENEASITLATHYFNQGLLSGDCYTALMIELQDALKNPNFCKFFKAYYPQATSYFHHIRQEGKSLSDVEFDLRTRSINMQMEVFVQLGYDRDQLNQAIANSNGSYLTTLINIGKLRKKKGQ